MILCEQCGSIRVSKAQPAAMDTLVAIFTARRPFICRRCGWRARRRWTDEDFRRLENYVVGGAEYDPSLAVLDEKPKAGRRGEESPNGVSGSSPRSRRAASDEFDLDDMDLSGAKVASADRLVESGNADSIPKLVSKRASRRRSERRRRRSRRREILATVALTALTMFIVVIMSLTGSCTASEF
jgi:hypothetical protein